jgi:response regulator of citrate/malate metabolism
VPEIRYLIARLLLKPIARARFVMAWSRWRQQHQSAAANAHRKRQNKLQL